MLLRIERFNTRTGKYRSRLIWVKKAQLDYYNNVEMDVDKAFPTMSESNKEFIRSGKTLEEKAEDNYQFPTNIADYSYKDIAAKNRRIKRLMDMDLNGQS